MFFAPFQDSIFYRLYSVFQTIWENLFTPFGQFDDLPRLTEALLNVLGWLGLNVDTMTYFDIVAGNFLFFILVGHLIKFYIDYVP